MLARVKTMTVQIEYCADAKLEAEDLEVERDLQLAAVDAMRRARRYGTFYVIWEDNQIKSVPPDQTGPYEERALTNAERINQRILAVRQAAQPPSEVMLNDKSIR
jgi:hypothetical protein